MRKRKIRYRPPLPAPVESGRIYIRIASRDVAMFRFLLEAEDNLGYLSVLDRWRALLKVVFSPHQTKQIKNCLSNIREVLEFETIAEALPSGEKAVPPQAQAPAP